MSVRAEAAKRLVARLGSGQTFTRRLPADLGGCRFPAALDGGTKFLRLNAHRFDPPLTRFAQRYVQPGSTVWDIGANVGLFTFVAAGLAGRDGRVLAVEADTWLVGNLRRAAARNPDAAQVTVLPAAASAGFGFAEFVVSRAARATSHLASAGGSGATGGVRERQLVPTVPLDALLPLGRPDVLKIDIEGGEVDALAGASQVLAGRPVLLMEVYEQASETVHDLLEPYGYRYLDPADHLRVERPTFNVIAVPV